MEGITDYNKHDDSCEDGKTVGLKTKAITVLKYSGTFFVSVVALCLLFIVNVLILLTLYFSSGQFRGIGGWLGLQLLSIFIIMSILILPAEIVRRRWKANIQDEDDCAEENRKAKCFTFTCFKIFLVCFSFIILVLSQIMLWLVVPRESIFPLEPRNLDAFSEESTIVVASESELHIFASVKFRPPGCDMISLFNETKAVFRNSGVDFTDVRIVYGGSPGYYNTANAMVLDKTIYLALKYCPSIYTLVHEVVHIWQFQQDDIWFSPAASVFWDWILLQSRCRACPYDYGGLSGLEKANVTGHTIRDFGVEMQAMIVENYYFYLTTGGQADPEFVLLQKFALQILKVEP